MESSAKAVAHDFPPFFRVFEDGTVERLLGTETVPPTTDSFTGVQSKDVTISAETGVSARLFLPKTASSTHKLPLLIYVHGGAFSIESPFSPAYHSHVSSLVAEANVVALSIHYRRAPEHPLPIAYDDTWAAMKWAATHCRCNGPEAWLNDHVDFERVFVAGDSAGANIAHVMVRKAGDDGLEGVKIVGMVLVHPYFGNDRPDKLLDFVFPTISGPNDHRIYPNKDSY
ncbi:putative carboxylesterase 5 [Morella rubra]|uniref:Putative carboxylesterase 5 n=1 Tax=Morella rubra TaxID=262757 RepID=A0A6A1V315_9ROSI|nr:putative carboxylesterase 5 [Morella rubra]